MGNYKHALLMTLTLLVVVIVGVPGTLNSKIMTTLAPDVSGDEILAVVVEDFENATTGDSGWAVESTPKKFEKAETEEKLKMKNPVPELEVKVIPGGPNDMNAEEWSLTGLGKQKEKILGVNFRFLYPGVNSVHLIPPPEVTWQDKKAAFTYNPNTRKDEQERAVQLPGKARAVSVWVHGRGNPYDLEVWVKDYRGDTHILKFGSVNFVGWRPMTVEIPTSVPQAFESYPQTRITKIMRLVLRAQTQAHAEELTANTYFFFDQIKVLTDTYEVNFDGQELHKKFEGGETGGQNNQ